MLFSRFVSVSSVISQAVADFLCGSVRESARQYINEVTDHRTIRRITAGEGRAMFLPVPMEFTSNERQRKAPAVVWWLVAINVLCYLLLSPWSWGVGPGSGPWSIVTYGFVHAGGLHLLVNMWFLWVFGRPVNRRIGNGWFAALYVGTIILVGFIAQVSSSGYFVGSSGAVFAVIAVASMLLPAARIRVHYLAIFPITLLLGLLQPPRYGLFWFVRWGTFTQTVLSLAGTYLVLQLCGLVAALFYGLLDWTSLGHLLGFACGVALVLVMPQRITMGYRASIA